MVGATGGPSLHAVAATTTVSRAIFEPCNASNFITAKLTAGTKAVKADVWLAKCVHAVHTVD